MILDFMRQTFLMSLQTVHLKSNGKIAVDVVQSDCTGHVQVNVGIFAAAGHRGNQLGSDHLFPAFDKTHHMMTFTASLKLQALTGLN